MIVQVTDRELRKLITAAEQLAEQLESLVEAVKLCQRVAEPGSHPADVPGQLALLETPIGH